MKRAKIVSQNVTTIEDSAEEIGSSIDSEGRLSVVWRNGGEIVKEARYNYLEWNAYLVWTDEEKNDA